MPGNAAFHPTIETVRFQTAFSDKRLRSLVGIRFAREGLLQNKKRTTPKK
jgi:hypothetical protein